MASGRRRLLVHTYGGIGGPNREKAASGPIYFGHFAYGVAEVVHDALGDELRFDVTYYQVYTQNADGLVAGALDWSRYMGDRQYGWAGVRPICDAVLRLDALGERGSARRWSPRKPLDALVRQLEVMTARYRIGDGTGGTFVGAANNCSQDSNRALFAALSSAEFARSDALRALAKDLRKKLQSFGARAARLEPERLQSRHDDGRRAAAQSRRRDGKLAMYLCRASLQHDRRIVSASWRGVDGAREPIKSAACATT